MRSCGCCAGLAGKVCTGDTAVGGVMSSTGDAEGRGEGGDKTEPACGSGDEGLGGASTVASGETSAGDSVGAGSKEKAGGTSSSVGISSPVGVDRLDRCEIRRLPEAPWVDDVSISLCGDKRLRITEWVAAPTTPPTASVKTRISARRQRAWKTGPRPANEA